MVGRNSTGHPNDIMHDAMLKTSQSLYIYQTKILERKICRLILAIHSI